MVVDQILCPVLTTGASLMPEGGAANAVVGLGAVATYIVSLLPIQSSLIPVFGAFLGGYALGKHTILTLILVFILSSIAVQAGLFPICTPI